MIKLLFIDDQLMTLNFLENCFRNKDKYKIVGSLRQAALAERWCLDHRPDAIFMDIQTKEETTNGLLIAQQIKEKFPTIKILLITGFDEISFLPRAKSIGVDAFITKSNTEEYFVETLRKVMADKTVFPEEATQIPVITGENPLTDREIEVLRLICEDLSNKEISDRLNISVNTVNHYIKSLLKKTQKVSRAGLVAYAIANEWINPKFNL